MKFQHAFVLSIVFSLAPLVLAGCGGSTVSSTQPSTQPGESVESSDPAASAPQTPIAQSPEAGSTEAGSTDTGSIDTGSITAEVIKSGSFASGEHPTQGMAQLVRQENGIVLQLDQSFQTSTSGPDLFVVLHRSEDVLGSTEPPAYPLVEGEYVVLAPLQNYSGTQAYEIPSDINVDDYRSAVIWCRQFNATFGAAVLQ